MVLGDSITQIGTYVSFMEYFLQKTHPDTWFDIVSVGLASETASGLSEAGHADGAFPRPCVHERLKRALDAVKPQVVVACYGINDGIYEPYGETIKQAFRDGITRLVETCRAAGAEVILVTPPVFDITQVRGWSADPDYDRTLDKFAEWEVQNPPDGVVAVVDLHTAMRDALAERRRATPGFCFAEDGVHPGELGHFFMAQSILSALRIPMPEGSAESLLAAAAADPMFRLVCQHRETRSEGWLNYIGYTRERKVEPKSGNIDEVESKAKDLQQQIDALRFVKRRS